MLPQEPSWRPSDFNKHKNLQESTTYIPYLPTRSQTVEPPNVRIEVCCGANALGSNKLTDTGDHDNF